ncbi:putative mixed-lineage leukemia protein, mll [Schistosoma mansoni]|uniref:putative mixed-lineage leukemia protein, mll n=1 Tax=Schistosoma mansoni TaxID=6183 RepID=UPI0001A631BD|nr:putative mixed-lineage leukemia protein, mll [Schistosoma mansoni]|eukprot:XP_018649432.1 putative mixed-lineage leukemia protein, mll [Schistosoma mansoni]
MIEETTECALKEIGNNSTAEKIRKSSFPQHSSLFHIDEDATTKLHQLIDFSLISKSLNLSPIHWKSVPQLYGVKSKHNSAICGVVIKRKRNKKTRPPVPERASLDKCKERKKSIKSDEAIVLPKSIETHANTSKQSTAVRNIESKNPNRQLPTVVEDNVSEDLTFSSVGKRQRRLTARAAEAIAQANLRKSRKSLAGTLCSKNKVPSDDDKLGSENENKTVDGLKATIEETATTIISPNKRIGPSAISPCAKATLSPEDEKIDLGKGDDKSLNVVSENVSPVIPTAIGECNFEPESLCNETLIVPDSLPHIEKIVSPNIVQNESFSEITTTEASTEDQLPVLVTSPTCSNEPLPDIHESESRNECLDVLDDLIKETLTVLENNSAKQQEIYGVKSPYIQSFSDTVMTQEDRNVTIMSNELINKTTPEAEIPVQNDLTTNIQLTLPEEKDSVLLVKTNENFETKETKHTDEASDINNQEQTETNDESDKNMESNSFDDSASTPPMKSDVQVPTVTKLTKSRAHKRSPSPTDVPIVRSKRRLKVNHRFLDDYDGYLGFMSGGRRSRASSEVSNGSEGSSSRNMEHSTRHLHTASCHDKKNSSDKVKKASHRNLTSTKSSSKGYKSNDNMNNKHEDKGGNRPVTGLRPRVKQVSRPSISREDSRYSSTLSAMVHAARLAAVGAKVPGGVSPVHAALAASAAHSNRMKEKHSASKQDDAHVTGHGVAPQNAFHPSRPGSTSQHSTHLPNRCGQCPACLGLIQPCGRCNDCRELICLRRRAAASAADQNMKAGPRVKFPSNYPSPGSTSNLPISGYKGALSMNIANHTNNRSNLNKSEDEPDESVSLLQTVPGLAQQLELDTWLPSSYSRKTHANGINHSYRRKHRNPVNNLNVGPELQVTPVRGGDLGMHFNSITEENDENEDLDRVRPVEGEVIDSDLATHGGYAIVTTLAAAPPKEICYACGSGGGQLLFCVSCAEPFHFYCVERQFRPRRKEHFVCRNCTTCKVCRRPASDLRCIRCSTGYHPECLADFPPAKTSQRGCWTCPECSVCLHCGVRACKPAETTWSYETNKCAACSQAESKGDVCPECDRAYLPTTKQMIQCDSCQLWMHRTCTKLTVDEYELIARMSAGQLSKFVVSCSVCQREQKCQQKKSNTSRSNNNNTSSKQQLDSTGQTASDDESEFSDENKETEDASIISRSKHCSNINNRNNNNDRNNGANQLRTLAQDTLMERMAGLVQVCRKSNRIDHQTITSSGGGPGDGSSMNSPSSTYFHSPTNTMASSSGKSPGYWSNTNYKDESTTVKQYLPQYDGVCDSDSGDELTAAVEAAASLWDPAVAEHAKFNTVPVNPIPTLPDNIINDPVHHHSDKLSCETVYNDTFNNMADISLDPVSNGCSSLSYSSSQQCLQIDTSYKTSNMMDPIINTCNHTVSSNETFVLQNQQLPLTVNTSSLLKTESSSSIQSSLFHESTIHDNNTNQNNRRRYSSSSSSSSRYYHQICSTPPPINAQWLVDQESEQIWTSPRSLLYRLLTRILHRLSAHPVSSPAAVGLRRLLRWLSTMTDTLFPWLNINEMASDVRDILRQSNGKFSDVAKHFQERSLIELHELVCPVIARLNENCSRIRNPLSGQIVNNVNSVSTCYLHVLEHLKEYHPKYQLYESPEIDPLEFTKQFLFACKRSRCQRPYEVEMLEQMKQSARDDRWVEHWSSIEEELVVKKFQNHLIKLYRKRLHELSVPSSQHFENKLNSKYNVTEMPNCISNSELAQLNSVTTAAVMDNNPELSNHEVIKDDNQLDTNTVADQEFNQQDSDIPVKSLSPVKDSGDCENKSSTELVTFDSERFYFALDKFWNEEEIRKPIVLSGHIPSFRLVDLDEEEELNKKAAADALRKHLIDDLEDEDPRRCLLCGYHGDDNIEGRLLYTGSDTWVHVNCALWCNDVYEEDSGELIGLSDAIRRGRSSKCADCGKYGATLYCSNMKTDVCPLAILVSSNNCDLDCVGAVHFSCALRRCPPLPHCVFTADRSWFCSPVCHHTVMNQRLAEALHSLKKSSKGNHNRKFGYPESWDHSSDEDFSTDSFNPADFADHPSFASMEEAIADDLEPIGLGDLLVCRRVFVPSDCFAASVYPQSINGNLISNNLLMSDDEQSELVRAAKEAVSTLAVSPNSICFLHNNGISAKNLVITIGSLRVDRLGEVREASDSLAMAKWIPGSFDERNTVTQSNFLCPINYRARRIYWSWSKLDSRIPYTLQVKQSQTVHTTSGYMETCPTSRPSSNTNVNSNKSVVLSKLPVVNPSNSTPVYKNPRLVNVDNRIRLLTPLNNRSPSCVFASNTNSIISTTHNIINSSINNNVKSINNTLSSVQDASKTLTAILTNTPSIVSSQTGCEPPLLMSHPISGHLVNVASYSTLPVSSFQLMSHTINNPINQGQIIQSSALTGQNSSLKIVNTVNTNNTNSLTLPYNKSIGPTVIRIQNVHLNQKTGILTTPTKDTQLATQLDGLFQNIGNVTGVSQNKRGVVSTNLLPQPEHQLLPQFDGTGDDDDPDYGSGSIRKRLYKTRSSSLVSSGSSSYSHRTAASGRSQSRLSNNRLNKNDLLIKASKNARVTSDPLSTKPSGKRRWIEDRIRQQELAHLVSKAKQANHARLYQNEVEKHARSFRLTFSIDGMVRSANSPMAAWRAVIMRVSALREKQGLKPLICTALHCYRYRFRYHWQKIDRLRQKFTPPVPCSEGCARAVPWTKPRRPRNHAHDPLGFLHCKANPPPRPLVSSGDDNLLPYQDPSLTNTNEPAKLLSPNEQATCREAARQAALLVATQLKLPQRLRKSCIAKAVVRATGIPLQSTPPKSVNDNELVNSTDQVATQFSRLLSGSLARFYRVSVHPSRIHGRGLFALREFREDEMVIEYTGELIRSIICDARELKYRATGVDCYMFRIDPDWVIDATYAGNAARFINHACDPNCYAKVVSIDDKKHIVILAQRKIYPGEELTYDYRFPKESDKLPCNCGSYSCRKYLN